MSLSTSAVQRGDHFTQKEDTRKDIRGKHFREISTFPNIPSMCERNEKGKVARKKLEKKIIRLIQLRKII